MHTGVSCHVTSPARHTRQSRLAGRLGGSSAAGVRDSRARAVARGSAANTAAAGALPLRKFLGRHLVPAASICTSTSINVYAYCRISDDLGDEVGDPQASLQLLDAVGSGTGRLLRGNRRGIRCLLRLRETVRDFRHSASSRSPIC